jgi:hypothetical protein
MLRQRAAAYSGSALVALAACAEGIGPVRHHQGSAGGAGGAVDAVGVSGAASPSEPLSKSLSLSLRFPLPLLRAGKSSAGLGGGAGKVLGAYAVIQA